MADEVLIGIDAGTSVIKAVAFDGRGRQLEIAARPNSVRDLPGGGVEQDLTKTWNDTAAVLRELVERMPGLPERVVAVGVTGQGDGTWLVDEAGEPVGDGWLWLDSRAAPIIAELEEKGVVERLYRRTGCGMNISNQSGHLVWLDRHEPERLDRAATAFHCKDWLYLKLTGERATDVSEGTFTFGDYRTRSYVPEILDELGIAHRRGLLPPMLDGSRTTHPLSEAAAQATGLKAGTPIALGFLDVACTALGGGMYEPGHDIGCSIVGSTGMHMRFVADVDDVVLGDEPSGYTMPFMVPGSVSRNESNMAATLNLDWVMDLGCSALALHGFELDRRSALMATDRRVLEGRAGAAIYHPYIHEAGERGPFSDPNARAQIMGLTPAVGYLDLVRSVYEGLGFAARDCYLATGAIPEEIRVAGGAARSKSLRTILASVLGAPVRESSREEAGAAGAAMMAAVAVGALPDFNAACEVWVRPLLGDRVMPEPALATIYEELFPLYVRGHRGMRSWWADLAAARRAVAQAGEQA